MYTYYIINLTDGTSFIYLHKPMRCTHTMKRNWCHKSNGTSFFSWYGLTYLYRLTKCTRTISLIWLMSPLWQAAMFVISSSLFLTQQDAGTCAGPLLFPHSDVLYSLIASDALPTTPQHSNCLGEKWKYENIFSPWRSDGNK